MRRIGFGSTAVAAGLLLGAGLPEPGGADKSQVVERELDRFQGTWRLDSTDNHARSTMTEANWQNARKLRAVFS